MLKVTPDPNTLKILEMVEQTWKQRANALKSLLTYNAAQSVLDDVLAKIPNSSEYDEYRKSLRVSKITGLKTNTYGYAAHARLKTNKLNRLDPDSTLIYVARNKRPARANRAVALLESNSPWTFDTIPWFPPSGVARITYRKVSEPEVTNRERYLNRIESKLKPQFARAGVRAYQSKKERSRAAGKIKVSPSISKVAFELEFGITGSARPAWRPAIHKFVNSTLRNLSRSDSRYIKAMTDPGDTSWTKYENLASSTLAVNDMSDFKDFFKRLVLPF